MPTLQRSSVGRYRIIDFVGAGGMGEVYRVVDTDSGRIAALKVLTATRGSSMVERFRNEARIHSTLQHPGIATMYGFLEADDLPCIAMEFVDGETIEHRIQMTGAMSVAAALPVFAAIVDVVSYLHQRGVVHRDLKSNNVKIDGRGAVKLLDFGIAQSHHTPKLTTDGSVVGTLHYLSPEQLRTGQAGPHSDLWALGVLLYEMVTGIMPFAGGALGVVTERLLKGSYVPASIHRPEIGRDVDRLIARCLRPSVDDRYASAEALLTDVRALLPGERRTPPRLALDAATSGEIVRHVRRHGALGASIGAAALALAFLVWSLGTPDDTIGGDTTLVSPNPPSREVLPARPGSNSPGELVLGEGERSTITLIVPGGIVAEVVRDGRVIGTTPFRVRAPAGMEVTLLLRHAGYREEHLRFTMTVLDTEFQQVLLPITEPDPQGFALWRAPRAPSLLTPVALHG
ncbi:MAG: serine/threonine protein kinase [Cytophagaceae bacterium]|nr:serine/threonine protein kinase [Gemmatimonadaceae bacterium]